MIPPISPAEIAAVILAELLFGIGFNQFVVWEKDHSLWPMAVNVIIGTVVTVGLPTLVWWRVALDFWQASALLTFCFCSSGLPMFLGSAKRKVEESHKRRPWPTAAAQARDAAVMDMNVLADDVAAGKANAAQVANSLHRIIGTLKSV